MERSIPIAFDKRRMSVIHRLHCLSIISFRSGYRGKSRRSQIDDSFAASERKLRRTRSNATLDKISRWSSKCQLIDLVDGTGRISLTVPFTYRYRHTPWTNGAARARRLVDRDAINEINLSARWNDRLRGRAETRSKSRRPAFLGRRDSQRRIRRGRDNYERR